MARATSRSLTGDGVLVQAGCEHRDAALGRRIVNGSMDGAGEGIGDILEHQPERSCLATPSPQARGGEVGSVVQLQRRVLDPFGQVSRNAALIIDDAGDRLDADAGQRGYVPHRGAAVWPRHRVCCG